MATSPIVSSPIQQHQTSGVVWSLLVCTSSLYLGLTDGRIEQWNSPGEVERTLRGQYGAIYRLLQCGDVLWSGSQDKIICLWKISSGECIKTLSVHCEVYDLVRWGDRVVGSTLNDGILMWSTDGTLTNLGEEATTIYVMQVWNAFLCFSTSYSDGIVVWKDYSEIVLTLTGQNSWTTCMAPAGEYLFSGSHDTAIRKWNEAGQCVMVIKHHTDWVKSLLVYNGELYSGSCDKFLKRISLEGQLLEEYKGHTSMVLVMTAWRGALFSGSATDNKLIQWTPFHLWSATRHKEYSQSIKEGIKTVMLLAASKNFPSHAIPTDVLFVIFQFYVSVNRE